MNLRRERPPRSAFLLGKPVREDTIFPEIFARLGAMPATVTVHLPTREALPDSLYESDLIVQRGLGARELESVLRLEAAGVRCCNPIASTLAVADRAVTAERLIAAGLPVPATTLVVTRPEAVRLAAGQPAVVKAVDGSAGRSLAVLVSDTGSLPLEPPFPGPYIVQDYVPNDGRVHKVYVAGREARGLIKRLPDQAGLPFNFGEELAGIARQAGAALNLDIFGVDVLDARIPTIVDVNPFPGFRGVPDAARLIAEHLAALATIQPRGAYCR